MSIEPGGPLDAAIARHPAARGGLGFVRVELAPPRSIGGEVVPPVYVLECRRCGALLRIGSPHLLDHHRAHRRPSPMRRVRGWAYRADRWVRALLH